MFLTHLFAYLIKFILQRNLDSLDNIWIQCEFICIFVCFLLSHNFGNFLVFLTNFGAFFEHFFWFFIQQNFDSFDCQWINVIFLKLLTFSACFFLLLHNFEEFQRFSAPFYFLGIFSIFLTDFDAFLHNLWFLSGISTKFWLPMIIM